MTKSLKRTDGTYALSGANASNNFSMAIFPENLQEVNEFCNLIGRARFDRYLNSCDGNYEQALELYVWNARVSQAFYLPIQIWEITLRNQMNRFLIWKSSNAAWPYDQNKVVKRLKNIDQKRLNEVKERQQNTKGVSQATTDAIVADLSAGFWVSMLTTTYDFRFSWRYNLGRVFPNAANDWRDENARTPQWDHNAAHEPCDRLLNLRNRIAHHEPVYALDLHQAHQDAVTTITAMSKAASNYLAAHCTVQSVLAERP